MGIFFSLLCSTSVKTTEWIKKDWILENKHRTWYPGLLTPVTWDITLTTVIQTVTHLGMLPWKGVWDLCGEGTWGFCSWFYTLSWFNSLLQNSVTSTVWNVLQVLGSRISSTLVLQFPVSWRASCWTGYRFSESTYWFRLYKSHKSPWDLNMK